MTDIVPPIRASRETIGERRYVHGHTQSHGESLTYSSWRAMRARCNNSKSASFARYGAAGIKHDPRWSSFSAFLADMGERPSRRHTLDRWPDRTGNYELGNCRWATPREQRLNQSRTRSVIRSDGKQYSSMLEAALDVGGRSDDIGSVCAGRQKTHRGYGWRVAQ